MLLHKASQKLILNLRDQNRVKTVIPTAKSFEFRGSTLLAVPYRLDEVRVLRNLGFNVPSPIRSYYTYPRDRRKIPQPFQAQVETSDFLTMNPRAFVLNDMGTGKTMATLWAFDYLRAQGRAKKMLVISPLSTLERTWADEINKNFYHLKVAVLHGSKERRLKLLADDMFDVYVINHDGIKVIQQELIDKTDIDTVVVDEIASFRNASAQRWKSLKKVVEGRTRLWGLTGTPTPNEPTDAWAQCRLICPERVPKFAGAFRDQVMKQLGPFKWAARPNATEIVANAMQPSIRFSREECVDLPPCVHQTLEVKLTPEQSTAYKTMVTQLVLEHAQGKITAVNEAVKVSKLLQIACGVIYGSDGSDVVIPCAPRIQAVKEVIEQAGSKVLVFVPFKGALRYVTEQLRQEYGEDQVAMISGDVGASARAVIFKDFQESARPRVICAVADAMSHGLTLTAASVVIWYAPTFKNETYNQANARVSRPGQKLQQLIVHIEATAAERRAYARLKDKSAMEGLLLDIIQEERDT